MTPMYFYKTYGLVIASELLLPELVLVEEAKAADVTIRLKPLPETLGNAVFPYKGAYFQASGDTCQFLAKGIARYHIEQGCRIFIDRDVPPIPEVEATDSAVRLYLLGTALGALLHQRRWLPLHISALATPSGVWAFTGPSGAGKSTLAAWLHYTQGWPLVSDDVAVLKPKDELPYLYPGPPRLKLWQDALAALGIEKQGLTQDLTRTDKYHLRLHQKLQNQPQPLRAIVMLKRSSKGEFAHLNSIKGVETFQAVAASLYRPELGESFNCPKQLFHQIAQLSRQISAYHYYRPWVLADIKVCLQPLLLQIHRTEQFSRKGKLKKHLIPNPNHIPRIPKKTNCGGESHSPF